MRLADFISSHMEKILTEWEAFAATLLPAADGLDALALRDHAKQILEAIAIDLGTSQTRFQQSEKSKGRAPEIPGAPDTAAQTHAVLRARGGFDINQLVAEYRALRASVLRLWMDFMPLQNSGLEDVIRFNEAIDQAVAESVGHYHLTVERYRNLLLGMLGHDMRAPLSCIIMTAKYLAAINAGEEVSEAAARLIRSGASMRTLLDDLTDFNRTNLGLGIKVSPEEVNLAKMMEDELELLRTAYPKRQIDFAAIGNTQGRWDGPRVQQILRNLVSNAIRYGAGNAPVRVVLRGEQQTIELVVSNSGALDPDDARKIFEPMHRGAAVHSAHEGLGLGLFIVREISKAHGGDASAHSEGNKTTFTVHLPREHPAA